MNLGKGPSDDIRDEDDSLQIGLRQRRKLETLGRLSGHYVHDFNNLLMVIEGYARLILEAPSASSDLREHSQEILRMTSRGAELSRQLLRFSRKPSGASQVLDLNESIRKLGPLLERLLGDSVRLELALTAIPLWIAVEPDQLEQVILNLVVNARDATPLGGKVSLATNLLASSSSQWVEFSVKDTGVGIPPDVLPRIFDPYFTTKAEGYGTGIGLALVQETVQAWGASITVESQHEQGAEFRLRIPPGLPAPVEHDQSSSSVPKAWILLAEDEIAIRTLISRALRQEGYGVLTAANTEEALQLCDSHSGIQVLIADLELAGADGRILLHEAKKRQPALRSILISGYSDPGDSPGQAYLQKPFTPATLVLVVQKLLLGERIGQEIP